MVEKKSREDRCPVLTRGRIARAGPALPAAGGRDDGLAISGDRAAPPRRPGTTRVRSSGAAAPEAGDHAGEHERFIGDPDAQVTPSIALRRDISRFRSGRFSRRLRIRLQPERSGGQPPGCRTAGCSPPGRPCRAGPTARHAPDGRHRAPAPAAGPTAVWALPAALRIPVQSVGGGAATAPLPGSAGGGRPAASPARRAARPAPRESGNTAGSGGVGQTVDRGAPVASSTRRRGHRRPLRRLGRHSRRRRRHDRRARRQPPGTVGGTAGGAAGTIGGVTGSRRWRRRRHRRRLGVGTAGHRRARRHRGRHSRWSRRHYPAGAPTTDSTVARGVVDGVDETLGGGAGSLPRNRPAPSIPRPGTSRHWSPARRRSRLLGAGRDRRAGGSRRPTVSGTGAALGQQAAGASGHRRAPRRRGRRHREWPGRSSDRRSRRGRGRGRDDTSEVLPAVTKPRVDTTVTGASDDRGTNDDDDAPATREATSARSPRFPEISRRSPGRTMKNQARRRRPAPRPLISGRRTEIVRRSRARTHPATGASRETPAAIPSGTHPRTIGAAPTAGGQPGQRRRGRPADPEDAVRGLTGSS